VYGARRGGMPRERTMLGEGTGTRRIIRRVVKVRNRAVESLTLR
jgi:hypothetical protein